MVRSVCNTVCNKGPTCRAFVIITLGDQLCEVPIKGGQVNLYLAGKTSYS